MVHLRYRVSAVMRGHEHLWELMKSKAAVTRSQLFLLVFLPAVIPPQSWHHATFSPQSHAVTRSLTAVMQFYHIWPRARSSFIKNFYILQLCGYSFGTNKIHAIDHVGGDAKPTQTIRVARVLNHRPNPVRADHRDWWNPRHVFPYGNKIWNSKTWSLDQRLSSTLCNHWAAWAGCNETVFVKDFPMALACLSRCSS